MHIGACGRHSQRNTLTVHMGMDLAATSLSVRRVASKPLRLPLGRGRLVSLTLL